MFISAELLFLEIVLQILGITNIIHRALENKLHCGLPKYQSGL
jgi:hypothetical protein